MVLKIILGFLLLALVTSLIFILAVQNLNNPIQAFSIAVIASIAIAIGLGYFFGRSVCGITSEVEPVSFRSEKSRGLAFRQRAPANSRLQLIAKEIANIANMLGYTSGYMDILTNQTEENAREIFTASNQVAVGTSQESEVIQQIANQLKLVVASIEGVASGAQNQAKSVEYAANISDKINHSIQDITFKANTAAVASAQAAEAASQGGKTIKQTVEAINSIRDKVGVSARKVREMGARSEEISAIVDKITDIANQTNLLALNASIEAAHAGDNGLGFSVIAKEVRKLADNSVIATKEVYDLVKAIQSTANEAVLTMNMGVEEVEKGVESANQSGKALESIILTTQEAYQGSSGVVRLTQLQNDLSKELASSMASVSAVVEQNAAATKEMASGAEGINIKMGSISIISGQNSAAAGDVAKLTGDISSLVADGTASAQTLAEMASSLQNLVAPFTIQDEEPQKITRRYRSDGPPTFGIVLPTRSNFFWQTAIEFAQRGAKELGVNLIVCDSEEKPELMEQHLRDLVAEKVDGLLWIPYWGLGRKGLAIARKADIPVLLIDSYQGGLQPQSEEFPNYLAFVGPADETGAYQMGKYLLAQMPAAKDGKKYLAALDGPEGAPTAVIRHKGLVRAIKEHPEAVLVSSINADYQFELAEHGFYELLREYPLIQGVWAANDMMVQGAIQAAKKAGRLPGKDIFFVGMDLDRNSIKAIRAGEQLFDIGGHWLQLGFGLSILYDYLNGHSIPKGRSIVKLMLLPLTKDKLDQFEKDFPNGIPMYDFKRNSRSYNIHAPILFYEMKYSANG